MEWPVKADVRDGFFLIRQVNLRDRLRGLVLQHIVA